MKTEIRHHKMGQKTANSMVTDFEFRCDGKSSTFFYFSGSHKAFFMVTVFKNNFDGNLCAVR